MAQTEPSQSKGFGLFKVDLADHLDVTTIQRLSILLRLTPRDIDSIMRSKTPALEMVYHMEMREFITPTDITHLIDSLHALKLAGLAARIQSSFQAKISQGKKDHGLDLEVEQQEEKRSDVSRKGKAPDPSSVQQPGTSASDRVVTLATIQDLSMRISREWKNVGRILGLKKMDLEILERNNANHIETVYQMLLTWKQSSGMAATYRVLEEALQAAGSIDLQKMLYKQVEQQEDKCSDVSSKGKPPDVLPLLHKSLQKVFAEMTRSDSENLANFFMFPLKHVKAIVNSPSHSKDLLVELENQGIIQSALTDELFENLRALNVLTGRSEGSKSSIYRPSSTFIKHEEDWKPPDTMKITSSISGKGGLLQIPNTGIKLVFPPKAVKEEHHIQVKIIPPSLLNEPATFFSSNSSVVLQLLPNGLQLKREVSLTLPHCLTFANEEKAKAKVYVSHHEEGQRPRWEEKPLSPYIFHRSKCTVRLLGFCWVKIVIEEKEVEAKNIVVFATKDILQDKKTANIEVGYYEDIPGEPNILEMNSDMKPEKKMKLKFLKEGKQPLTVSFNGTDPGNTWAIEQDKPKKEISWQSIAGSEDRLVSFVLHRKQTQDSFCNVSAQQGNSDPITFVIKLEVNLSKGDVADSTVPGCILEYLATELAEEWQRLARGLSISKADLDNIKANNSGRMQDTKYFMLRHWSERNGTGATRRVLATALENAGRRDLKEYVESQGDQQINIKNINEDRERSSRKYDLKHKHLDARETERASVSQRGGQSTSIMESRESASAGRGREQSKVSLTETKSISLKRVKHTHFEDTESKSVSPTRAKHIRFSDGEPPEEHQVEDSHPSSSASDVENTHI